MRVLIVSCFRDGTGYAIAANEYATALQSVGVDVVCRAIHLNGRNLGVSEKVEEMLAKPLGNFDATIQILLPPQFEFNSEMGLNIGLYCTEFDQFNLSGWGSFINLMDEAWVFNRQSSVATIESGVNIPVKIVNPPCNTDKYFSSHKKFLPNSPNFRFYTIGEYVRRKNFAALVKAFHLEFQKDEPVELIIKTGLPGMSDAREQITYELDAIKQGMRLYPSPNHYKQELIITEYITEEELIGLHLSCDCYVSPSFGEAWNLPAYDSLGFGKTPILSDYAGHKDFADDTNAYMVAGRMEPVFAMNGVSPPFYATSRDRWFSVDVEELAWCMRDVYNASQSKNQDDRFGLEKMRELGLRRVEDSSYKIIGSRMKQLLEDAISRKKGDENHESLG